MKLCQECIEMRFSIGIIVITRLLVGDSLKENGMGKRDVIKFDIEQGGGMKTSWLIVSHGSK